MARFWDAVLANLGDDAARGRLKLDDARASLKQRWNLYRGMTGVQATSTDLQHFLNGLEVQWSSDRPGIWSGADLDELWLHLARELIKNGSITFADADN